MAATPLAPPTSPHSKAQWLARLGNTSERPGCPHASNSSTSLPSKTTVKQPTGLLEEACNTILDAYYVTKRLKPCATCSSNAHSPSKSGMMLWPGCAYLAAVGHRRIHLHLAIECKSCNAQTPLQGSRVDGTANALDALETPKWVCVLRALPPLSITWWSRSRKKCPFGLKPVP
jgi:hypothetical protein